MSSAKCKFTEWRLRRGGLDTTYAMGSVDGTLFFKSRHKLLASQALRSSATQQHKQVRRKAQKRYPMIATSNGVLRAILKNCGTNYARKTKHGVFSASVSKYCQLIESLL